MASCFCYSVTKSLSKVSKSRFFLSNHKPRTYVLKTYEKSERYISKRCTAGWNLFWGCAPSIYNDKRWRRRSPNAPGASSITGTSSNFVQEAEEILAKGQELLDLINSNNQVAELIGTPEIKEVCSVVVNPPKKLRSNQGRVLRLEPDPPGDWFDQLRDPYATQYTGSDADDPVTETELSDSSKPSTDVNVSTAGTNVQSCPTNLALNQTMRLKLQSSNVSMMIIIHRRTVPSWTVTFCPRKVSAKITPKVLPKYACWLPNTGNGNGKEQNGNEKSKYKYQYNYQKTTNFAKIPPNYCQDLATCQNPKEKEEVINNWPLMTTPNTYRTCRPCRACMPLSAVCFGSTTCYLAQLSFADFHFLSLFWPLKAI